MKPPHETADDKPALDLEQMLSRLCEHAWVLETNYVILGMVPSSTEVLIELMKGLLNEIETALDNDSTGGRRGDHRLCDHVPHRLQHCCPWPACLLGCDREARTAAAATVGDKAAQRGSTGSRRSP